MTYDVLSVARYLVNYSYETGSPIDNMKLQKLLYFVQGYSLAIQDEPMFFEDILNWQYGPVVREAYNEFRRNGHYEIAPINEYLEYDEITRTYHLETFDVDIFELSDIDLMEAVVDLFRDKSSVYMYKLTHLQRPWASTKRGDIISLELMTEYFKELQHGN